MPRTELSPRRRADQWDYFSHAHPLALAHRGGSYYEPNIGIENTAAAFANALDLGYTHLETDVHATADGMVIAFHDDRLGRVTDGEGLIAALPWSQVRRVRVGGREPIPTLADLLERFPTACFNIDLKHDLAVEPTLRIIDEFGAHRRVCLGSFNERRIRRAHRLSRGRIATSHSVLGSLAVKLLPAAGPTALIAGPGVALQVPISYRRRRIVDSALVGRAHRLGKHVHVWTIDDPAQMRRLLDLGVDGIVTDRPDLLRQVLVERGEWVGDGRH